MTETAGKAESLISACILFYCNATTRIWVRMRVAPVARSAAAPQLPRRCAGDSAHGCQLGWKNPYGRRNSSLVSTFRVFQGPVY